MDEIDLSFSYLHVLVGINTCGFTQQLGEYRVNKSKTKLDNINLLKAKYVGVYPNLFTFFEQEIAKDLHHQYDQFNKCKLEEK